MPRTTARITEPGSTARPALPRPTPSPAGRRCSRATPTAFDEAFPARLVPRRPDVDLGRLQAQRGPVAPPRSRGSRSIGCFPTPYGWAGRARSRRLLGRPWAAEGGAKRTRLARVRESGPARPAVPGRHMGAGGPVAEPRRKVRATAPETRNEREATRWSQSRPTRTGRSWCCIASSSGAPGSFGRASTSAAEDATSNTIRNSRRVRLWADGQWPGASPSRRGATTASSDGIHGGRRKGCSEATPRASGPPASYAHLGRPRRRTLSGTNTVRGGHGTAQ